jgi:hypothetical protein
MPIIKKPIIACVRSMRLRSRAAPVSIGAPKTVRGKIQMQVALRDAPKPPPPRFEDRPFAFGRVAVSAFLTDVFFSLTYSSH